jgi:hypothetical protein
VLPAEEALALAAVETVLAIKEHIVLVGLTVAVVGLGQTEAGAKVALERL